MSQAQSSVFRNDIEFLRGIAVTVVVLFHLHLSLFQSGFIGVDIFFVLSGYLMAAVLKGVELRSIIDFYERRARRILPAAIAVFVAVILVGSWVFLPFDTEKLVKSYVSQLFLIPNIGFWMENDYFDELTFRPMLHYWSLGVEFQYYFVFPLIYLLFRERIYAYVLLFFASLGLCIVLTEVSAKSAFFLLPARLWEFLAGFFAYQYVKKYGAIRNQYSDCIGVALIVLLVYLCTTEIPQQSFPGYHAILPVIATAALMTINLNVKSKLLLGLGPLFQGLGKISYSLYLVHYPVIIFFTYIPFGIDKNLSTLDLMLATAIMFGLSFCVYQFVEKPFRNRRSFSDKKFRLALIASYGFSVVLIASLYVANFFPGRYTQQQQSAIAAVTDRDGWLCSFSQTLRDYDKKSCRLTEESHDRKVLLAGDSHMDAIKNVFVREGNKNKIEVRLIKTSCKPGKGHCGWKTLIAEAERHELKDIVLHGYKVETFDYQNIEKLISVAHEKGLRVHFVEPIPTYGEPVPKFVFERTKENLQNKIMQTVAWHQARVEPFVTFKASAKSLDGITFHSTIDLLCEDKCLIMDEEHVYYHDSIHLNLSGSKLLTPIVTSIFEGV